MDSQTTINTGGGAQVTGGVSTLGGDFVGRDQIVHIHADVEAVERMVGLLRNARVKLVQQPPADGIDALGAVLDEISKIHILIESELVRYMSLSFNPASMAEERKALLMLEGGLVMARASEARGHCHKIDFIYGAQLRDWFRASLNADEFDQVERAFHRLGDSDDSMVITVMRLAEWLSQRATDTLDRVDAGDLQTANQMVREARRAVLPFRQELAKSVSNMRDLQADLISASSTTTST